VSVEIERAFVAGRTPDRDLLGPGRRLRQGYVAGEADVEVRVRISDDRADLTVKGGRGLTRTEVVLPLSDDDAEALWPLTEGRRIDKTRHRVPLAGEDGLVAEVDLFAGALAGLVRIEVEFASEEAARAFDPPAWFGREVTGERAWSNAQLARRGRPDEPSGGADA
jgi:CYTH domain-containing protein